MTIDVDDLRLSADTLSRMNSDERLRNALVVIIGAEVLRIHGLDRRSRIGALAELAILCLDSVMHDDDWQQRPDR